MLNTCTYNNLICTELLNSFFTIHKHIKPPKNHLQPSFFEHYNAKISRPRVVFGWLVHFERLEYVCDLVKVDRRATGKGGNWLGQGNSVLSRPSTGTYTPTVSVKINKGQKLSLVVSEVFSRTRNLQQTDWSTDHQLTPVYPLNFVCQLYNDVLWTKK